MSQRLVGLVAIGVALATAQVVARPLEHATTLLTGSAALGQADQPDKTKKGGTERWEVDKLLGGARRAIEDGRYETAESLIARAEAMNVDYGLFHVGDTPKKARRDLEARRRSKPQAPKPSQQFKPDQPAKESPAASPHKLPDEIPAVSPPSSKTPIEPGEDHDKLPSLDRRDRAAERAGRGKAAEMAPPEDSASEADGIPSDAAAKVASAENRRHSDALLLDARRALATGDARRATLLAEKAKGLKVGYGFHEDSPARVETLINKYKQVIEGDTGRQETEAARRQHAELLMEESEQLLRWHEYDEAERLAHDAARQKVIYGPFDASPKTLLERIAAERKKQRGGAAESAPAHTATAEAPAAEVVEPATPVDAGTPKEQSLRLTQQARAALNAGKLNEAEQLARQAESLKVPNTAFGPQEDRPWLVSLEIRKAKAKSGVTRAGGPIEIGSKYPVAQTLFDPNSDTTRDRQTSARDSVPAIVKDQAVTPETLEYTPTALPGVSQAMQLFQAGEQALRAREPQKAMQLFRDAYNLRDQLDPVTQQRLQDHLQLLSVSPTGPRPGGTQGSLIDSATAKQQLVIKQLSADIARQQKAARELTEKDAKRAVEIIQQARATVESSEVDAAVKSQLLKRLDSSAAEIDKYVTENKGQIELDEENKEVLSAVDRRKRTRIEVDTKLAKLVDEYNQLMEERRFAEASVLAKRAQDLDPLNPVVKQLMWQNKFAIRMNHDRDLENQKEDAVVKAFNSVDDASVPFDDRDPIRFPDAQKWEQLKKRSKLTGDKRTRRTEREIEIEQKLKTPVSLKFKDKPLSEVLSQLAALTAINLYLDPKGLMEEGVAADTPVTIDLSQEVSLRSALKLILEPMHLSYVIKDEVLKITSEQLRDNEVYTVLYNVADLVIPIPNFVPSNRMGLAAALADAQGNIGLGGANNGFSNPMPNAVMASQSGTNASGMINPELLTTMQQNTPSSGGTRPGMSPQPAGGPGGIGGGQQADFDSLIELITSTIAPTSWDDVGGPGTVAEFATNLSLVISQTQEVHEQIVDLLEQLRRLQDLQVTIEVRFITLNDDFFEQIGVDFQARIRNQGITVQPGSFNAPSQVVGLNPPAAGAGFPNFTSDFAIPFTQTSFNLAVPQFAQPVNVANFGFAILSDIEAYFLVNASQGDRRSNVLQAPKVTLFNGQQAFVSDTSQTPFVISVVPVVGDFAAAQQPVIVVLNEGTFLTVQAVISNDRRFVRLTVVPFFSQIGNVQEFTFSGTKTTTGNTSSSKSATAGGDTTASNTNDNTTTTDGVTVQLPSFSFVTVTTTVSVPDGGTVLLGGIKRLSEGRNEFGVPILSKLPYINRLFKNVGIGRETQSLMMMVTPRIIIQEEEEDRLGIGSP